MRKGTRDPGREEAVGDRVDVDMLGHTIECYHLAQHATRYDLRVDVRDTFDLDERVFRHRGPCQGSRQSTEEQIWTPSAEFRVSV